MTFLPISRCAAIMAVALISPAFAHSSENPVPGVANFWKVNEHVYRGAQPNGDGFQALAKLGVKTVVDLRATGEHSQAEEQRLVESAGMRYVSVPMEGMTRPSSEQVSRVMALLNDQSTGPVFVHCQRGADRTGAIMACYRIAHDGWENRKALHEARSRGMSWYQVALQRYVMDYPSASQPQSVPAIAAAVPVTP